MPFTVNMDEAEAESLTIGTRSSIVSFSSADSNYSGID